MGLFELCCKNILSFEDRLMDKSIIQLVDELPTDNITVKVLKALNYVAPGEWSNLTGFENNIRSITGVTDAKVIQKSAIALLFYTKILNKATSSQSNFNKQLIRQTQLWQRQL